MLTRFEKLQFWFSGFILVVVVAFYMLLGPSTGAYMPDVVEGETEIIEIRQPPGGAAASPETPAETARREHLSRINEVLRKHKRRTTIRFSKKSMRVPHEAIDTLRNKQALASQLNAANSTLIRDANGLPTMLEIFEIDKGSYFDKLGIENGDQICLVDGGEMQFDVAHADRYFELFSGGLDRLEGGEGLSLTVIRGGRPVQLHYTLEDIR